LRRLAPIGSGRIRAAVLATAAFFGDPLAARAADPTTLAEPATGVERAEGNGPQDTSSLRQDSLLPVSLTASLTGVAQQVNGGGSASGQPQSRLNGRADMTVTLPLATVERAENTLFAHVRAGHGRGVSLRPTFTSTTNSTGFDTDGHDDGYAIVAQAWYQLAIPLQMNAGANAGYERIEITAGKIDPFAFFDQNAIADDETMRFLNNAFVHNPLLDSGGDAGIDTYGFAPGIRIAYTRGTVETGRWAASIGVFGSGPGAHFSGPFADRFFIAQLEGTQPSPAGAGTYRLYGWRNARSTDFQGISEMHSGLGFSADQPVGDGVTLFTRLAVELHGNVRFDRAFTAGAEIAGNAWRRVDDALAIAAAVLPASSMYRATTVDPAVAGYHASGTESIVEAYYRCRVATAFDLTADAQWLRHAGGDRAAPNIWVSGVRARIGF